ncbi:MAG TPA: FAD:protein FMN transferase, partial [Gemmatimonadales bacterium]|nr:FAD:protein FMN transferase [Gemmatimonadales bacterium]
MAHPALSQQAALEPVTAAPSPTWLEREIWIMGTALGARVSGSQAVAATEDAFRAVGQVDSLLSTWIPESELARVNRAPAGRPFPVSPALDSLLA